MWHPWHGALHMLKSYKHNNKKGLYHIGQTFPESTTDMQNTILETI